MEIRKDCFYSSASMKRTSKSRSLRTKKCLSKCIKRRKNFDKSLKIAYGNGIIASLTTKKKLFLWHFAVALRKESVDRNTEAVRIIKEMRGSSPQGERG